MLAAAADCADIADVQTIAFPQEGLLRDPGAYELMEAALELGAHVVGGMPHWEADEAAQREHVRLCFDLAQRFDRDIDMHVDETDDGGVRTLEMVADEALKRGYAGRVTAGHVCSLAAADEEYSRRVIDKCARAGISVAANPVTNLVLQGRGDRGLIRRGTTRIAELRAAGVNVLFGQDCVKDGFYPFGRGSMLEVALISAHAAHLTTQPRAPTLGVRLRAPRSARPHSPRAPGRRSRRQRQPPRDRTGSARSRVAPRSRLAAGHPLQRRPSVTQTRASPCEIQTKESARPARG